ncbi:hypothetical protein [Uliginosibacterium sp. 31-12]|uniref:hypothetical protein n=1 Tax=Uliginosibacterium sp. 31-12 TaxID=3062781 RepID=UPI0026E34BA2|nr:hypothetical protein [Uliginosibacterium sp. 31-12]MDO6385567.1 hypothetical protein [Uliginosibacterium sp. 31-12]
MALIASLVWSNREKWSWPATWISGLMTTLLGLVDKTLGTLNTHAAGLGVILTFAFGLMSWLEQRKRTKAVMEAAAAGTLRAEADD